MKREKRVEGRRGRGGKDGGGSILWSTVATRVSAQVHASNAFPLWGVLVEPIERDVSYFLPPTVNDHDMNTSRSLFLAGTIF